MSFHPRESQGLACIGDALECYGRRLRKFHRKAASAKIAPKMLAE
jgi:hypothetical protein